MNVLKEYLSKKNILAFLLVLRHCEGTAGENGYQTLFGGELFNDFNDHPGKFFEYKNKAGEVIKTSAAGAYQITHTTWVSLKKMLGLTDFTPESQDICALELIRENKAIDDVVNGRFSLALEKCRRTWASLPGSGNNQPKRSMAFCLEAYKGAGGSIVA